MYYSTIFGSFPFDIRGLFYFVNFLSDRALLIEIFSLGNWHMGEEDRKVVVLILYYHH